MTKEEYLKKIEEAKKRAMPKPVAMAHSCAGCLFLEQDGLCSKFMNYPPLDFIEKENNCKEYIQDIPF